MVIVNLTDNKYLNKMYKFFNGKYWIDQIVNHYIINASLKLGYILSKILDRGVIEILGPFGISSGLSKTSGNISNLDTGNVTSYAVYIAISIVVILLIVFIPLIMVPVDVRLIFVMLGAFILFNKLFQLFPLIK